MLIALEPPDTGISWSQQKNASQQSADELKTRHQQSRAQVGVAGPILTTSASQPCKPTITFKRVLLRGRRRLAGRLL